jgi:hypothetical protein
MATRDQLTGALRAAGLNYLTQTQGDDLIEQVVSEIGLQELWRWRYAEVTTSAGVDIADLGPIVQVISADGWPLEPGSPERLRDAYGPGIGTTGAAEVYWIEGRGILRTWPLDTRAFVVIHYSLSCWAQGGRNPSNGEDEMLIPHEFRDLVHTMARMRALADSDEPALVQALGDSAAQRMTELRDNWLPTQVDEADYVEHVGEWA